MYRILHQLGLLDSDDRANSEAFEKIRLLVRGRPGLDKTRFAVDVLAMTDSGSRGKF